MKTSFAGVSYAGLALAAGIAAALWFAPVPAAGQAPGGKAQGQRELRLRAPETARPISKGSGRPGTPPRYSLEAHNGATGIHAGKSFIVDPRRWNDPVSSRRPRKKQQENFENREKLDTMNHCYMTGVPRFTYIPFPFQIFQTPKQIEFISEYAHMVRNIYMVKQTHFGDLNSGTATRAATGKATPWWWTSPISTIKPGSTPPEITTATR